MATPLTQEHYLSTLEGSIYGYDHDIKRFSPEQAALYRTTSGIDGIDYIRSILRFTALIFF